MHSARFLRLCIIALVLLSSPLFVPASPADAQSGTVEVRVYGADYTDRARFPSVCVRVAPLAANGTVPADLGVDAFRVYEDGERRPVAKVSREYVGTQVAFVLDASGSFKQPAVTGGGKRRFDEAIEAIDELILTDKWIQRSRQLDQMLVVAPTGPSTVKVAQPWTEKYNAVHNAAYQLQPIDQDTPLYKLLVEAMTRMRDLKDYEQRAKFVVVLSDGVDRTSAQEGSDVISRADQMGVKILSVLIGPEADSQSKTLRRLAEESGGETHGEWAYTPYKGVSTLAPLYQAIKAQAEPYVVCYRSKIGTGTAHNLQVAVQAAGREYRSAGYSITVPVKPPQVTVTAPAQNAVISRVGASYDVDPSTIEPREQPVSVQVDWPDGYVRDIEQVSYEVDGAVVAQKLPTEPFAWDISRLAAGSHALRVIVSDELGVTGASDPVQVSINLSIPPAPAPTPTPKPGPRSLIPSPREQPFVWLVLIVAVVAIGIAVFVLLRRPKTVEKMTTMVTEAVRDATVVFRPKRAADTAPANAYLVPLLDDAGTRGEPIAIRAQSVNVGRDPARAQIIFSDRTVSRLHARLVEDADNVFMLYDEGSASGTYVNQQRIDLQPQTLKSGDIIEFGRVRVVFQTGEPPRPAVSASGFDVDQTEPFVPSRR